MAVPALTGTLTIKTNWERMMKLRTLTAAAIATVMGASPVLADMVFPSLSYRTGPYAANGIPFADGYEDYFTLINERDGGIGGVPIKLIECETGYNTEKGVECYESTKGQGALVYQPLSTGITYQLIPKSAADGIPLHTMGYGRTSAANGKVFNTVFKARPLRSSITTRPTVRNQSGRWKSWQKSTVLN